MFDGEPEWTAMGFLRPPVTSKERKLLKDVVQAYRLQIKAMREVVEMTTSEDGIRRAIEQFTAHKQHLLEGMEPGTPHCGAPRMMAVLERHLETLKAKLPKEGAC